MMLSSRFFTILLFLPLLVFAQPTLEVTKTFYKSKQIYEHYFVLISNPQIKHGPFVSYKQMTKDEWKAYKMGKLDINDFIMYRGLYVQNKKDSVWYEKGQLCTYKNGKKSGIWTEAVESGQVILRYDHDKQLQLEPIFNIQLRYPAMERENGIEGSVIVSFLVNEDCTLSDFKIIKSLSKSCDEEVLHAMQLFAKYHKAYPTKTCENKRMDKTFRFSLSD